MTSQNHPEVQEEGRPQGLPSPSAAEEQPPEEQPPVTPRWRPADEPTCCGSGCDDCPF